MLKKVLWQIPRYYVLRGGGRSSGADPEVGPQGRILDAGIDPGSDAEVDPCADPEVSPGECPIRPTASKALILSSLSH